MGSHFLISSIVDMGVPNLWNVLNSVKKTETLDYLKGKAVAIDLSIWICEIRKLSMNSRPIPTLYLRNIFFRSSKLLRLGVTPVFVMDGCVPDLKQDALANRIRTKTDNKTYQPVTRKEFNELVGMCQQMLTCLGVPCVQSVGEAEQMCALLNRQGVVDGCITDDSDAFLYGAKSVFKGFSVQCNKVDCYDMDDIGLHLSLDSEKLVALALLVGCDYSPHGVPGVGIATAMKLLDCLRHIRSVLERFREWTTPGNAIYETFNGLSAVSHQQDHCNRCGHQGLFKLHQMDGCTWCQRVKGCTKADVTKCHCCWHEVRDRLGENDLVEYSVWQKAIHLPNFPSEQVIDEFVTNKNNVPPTFDLEWKEPDIAAFLNFASEALHWSRSDAFQRIFVLWTKWNLMHVGRERVSDSLLPLRVLKLKRDKGIRSIEVEWNTESLKNVFSWTSEFQPSSPLISLESLDLFAKAFPDYENYMENATTTTTKTNAKKKRKS